VTAAEDRAPGRFTGERKLVTMLFADLAGYTALSETLDPEEVYTFLRPTMDELVAIAESFGGSVPQIQGDGFMAAFGVPVAHEDDAERAVRAALAVRDRIHQLNRDRRGIPLPEVHAGVRSGEVMVAPSSESAGFAVVGDTVNTAARLCSLARAGEILVDATTRSLTSRSIRYGPRRLQRAKGKAEPLETYLALAIAPAAYVSAGTTFVDREEILGRLGRELETVEAERRSRVLVVTGEPGIGKSRLAAELGHSLGQGRLFIGRCSPFGDQRRLGPLAEIVETALGIDTAGAGARRSIDRVARRIAGAESRALAADLRVLLLDDSSPHEAARTDRDLLRSARLVLGWAARDVPAVAVLDDLQWADETVIALLAEAAAAPWSARLVLLGLAREPVGDLPTLPLPALDEASMDLLAEALLGSTNAAEALRVPVTRANGNALFLEEMVGMLVERGAVRHVGDAWALADPGALDDVPATIRLLIAARLDALPPDEKRVLTEASVCGTVAWDGALASMDDPAVVASALSDLVARGLLIERPHSAIRGATEYAWRHALIRDVAYRALPRAARADRHEAIAAWLRETDASGGELLGAISYQYERAWELRRGRTGPGPSPELTREAAEFLTRRAEQVFARQARAAEPLFRRALRVVDEGAPAAGPAISARARVGLADVLIEMGQHDEANELARRARRDATRAHDDALTARALLVLGRSESDAGNLRQARRLLLGARSRFESLGDLRGQGWAWHRLSETWGWEGFDRELADLESAFTCFTQARDVFGRSVAANDLAYILSVQGGKAFHRWYRQAERLAADEGDVRSRATLLRTWGSYCYASGSFTEAAATMARCRPVAADAGDGYTEADAIVMGALAIAASGDPETAERMAREGIDRGRQLGSVRIPAMARLALARAAVRRGDRRTAAASLRSARAAVRERGLRVMHSDLAEAEAMLLLDRGAWAAAIDASAELRRSLDAVPMALWEPLPALIAGRAQLASGALPAATVSLQEAATAARHTGAAGTMVLARAVLEQARLLAGRAPRHGDPVGDTEEVAAIAAENIAIAAWRAGDGEAALAALDRAVERWASMGSTAWLARAHRMRADIMRARGDRARAAAAEARADAAVASIAMPVRERPTIARPLDEPRG
jgi:class 3 adenylate cyclase/tetratricopeptide (TPR) repeat protein